MTSVNVTEDKYSVSVTEGVTTVVTVKAPGPQGIQGATGATGPAGAGISAGDKGSLTVAANLTDWTLNDSVVTNAKVSASAAIAGTKISPNFGSQNIFTEGNFTINSLSPAVNLNDTEDNPDYRLANSNGIFKIRDTTNSVDRFKINATGNIDIAGNLDVGAGIDVTGNITVSGTVDSVDLSTYQADGGSYLRSDADDSFTGTLTGTSDSFNPVIQINGSGPKIIRFDSSDNTPSDSIDLVYRTFPNTLAFERVSDSQIMFSVDADDQQAIFNGNVDCNAGLDVSGGDITGTLGNGVTATTQSAGNSTTRVATTAFVSTAISNLINGAPSALDTLNELAAAMNDDAAFSTTVTNSLATKMPLTGGEFTGNITFSGSQTVDGRDLSVDGSKLDGIESGATADQTASEILTLLKTVDGAGSGLDADTLDGISSASFVRSDANDAISGFLTITNDSGIKILSSTNGVGSKIQFSDHAGGSYEQNGTLTYKHGDGAVTTTGGNSNDGWLFEGSETRTVVKVVGDIEATSNIYGGNIFIPDNDNVNFGSGNDLTIVHDGTDSKITNKTGDLLIEAKNAETGIKVIPDGAVELYHDDVKKAETTSTGTITQGTVFVTGTAPQIRLNGDSNDNSSTRAMFGLVTSANQFANNSTVNDVVLNVPQDFIISHGTTDLMAKFRDDLSVELYYDGSKKFETVNNGVTVSGNLFAGHLNAALDGNTSISLQDTGHGFAASEIKLSNGGRDLNIVAPVDIRLFPQGSENGIVIEGNGAVELYFNNSKKLATTATGLDVTGSILPDADNTNALGSSSKRFTTLHSVDLNTDKAVTTSSGFNVIGTVIKLRNTTNDADLIKIFHSGTGGNAIITSEIGNVKIQSAEDGGQVKLFETSSGTTTERLSTTNNGIDINGDIRGASGILFNNDTADANRLDDYEIGTWTPTVLSEGNIGTPQYTCTYTKIGRLVTINADIHQLSDTTSSSHLLIGGMPYVPTNTAGNWSGACHGERYKGGNNNVIVAFLHYASGSWKIGFRFGVPAGHYANVKHSDISDDGSDNNLRFTLTYEVA